MGNSDDHLKVLGMRESPYVNRVQVALNLKSLDYEFIPERNLLIEKSELLLKSNPVHKKVPVLIHNDKPISESLVIVEYIDEVWTTAGHSILPCDPYERADARFWAAYVDLTLFPALRELIGLTQDEDTKKAAAEKVIEGMLLLEDAFEKSSKGKAFFGGNEIGYLDIAFGCVLGWLKAVEIINKVKFLDEIKTPRLVEWATAFMSHGATENVVPGPEQLIEYSKTLPAKLAAAAAAAAVVSSN